MKAINYTYMSFVFLFACNNHEKISFFQPNKEMTLGILKSNGFETVNRIDVPMVGKSMGDTLIIYQFDGEFKAEDNPIASIVEIKIQSNNIDSLISSFKNSQTKVIVPCNEDANEKYITFYLFDTNTKFYYDCSILRDNPKVGQSKIIIAFQFPNLD